MMDRKGLGSGGLNQSNHL